MQAPSRLVLAPVLLVGLLLAPPAVVRAGRAADVRTEAYTNLALGVSAYKKGDYPLAVRLLEQAAAAALNNFRAHYYLGLALIGDRRYADALTPLEVALDLDPSHLQSHIASGNAQLKLGDLDEASASFYRALDLRPGYPDALDGLARSYEASSEDDKAIEYYRRAIEANRGFAPAYTHLGDLYLRQRRFEEAVELLEEAVSIRPDYTPGLNRLALAYGRLGLENEAVATIHKAIELEPGNASHPATLGELQLETGFVAAAEQSFRLALELDPGLPDARLGLAEVARLRGHYDDALEQVGRAIEDPRTEARTRARLEQYRARVEQEQERALQLAEAVQSGDAEPAAYGEMARILAGRRRWDEAAELQRKAGGSDEQLETLAFLLFQAGSFAEAHRVYDELSGRSERATLALNNGVTLALLGNDPRAAEAYRQALERDPDLAQARLYLANALLRMGEEQAAVDEYSAFLEETSGGEDAERVRRILEQLAPERVRPRRAPKPPEPAPADDTAAAVDGGGES